MAQAPELTDEALERLIVRYDLPVDCDCDDDDCVKCSHYPTFQEQASKALKEAAPTLARELLAHRRASAAPADDALRVAAKAIVDHELFHDRQYLSAELNEKLDALRAALEDRT